MRVSHDHKTGIHRVLLEHGGVCIMQSDPAGGPTRSFQRLAPPVAFFSLLNESRLE